MSTCWPIAALSSNLTQHWKVIESPKYLPNTKSTCYIQLPNTKSTQYIQQLPNTRLNCQFLWIALPGSGNLARCWLYIFKRRDSFTKFAERLAPFWGGGGKNYIACIHGPLGEGCEGGCRVNDGYAVCVHQKTVNHITIIHYLRFFDSVFQPSCHPHTHLPPSPSPGKISQLSWECCRFSWNILDYRLFKPLDKSLIVQYREPLLKSSKKRNNL